MASLLNQTVFDLPISKACQLIANASNIEVVKADSVVAFNKLELLLENGKIKFKLVLTVDGQEELIDNPKFKFDFENSQISVDDYIFVFFEQKVVDFCSLKDFLTSSSC